jgi:hypothetical protein
VSVGDFCSAFQRLMRNRNSRAAFLEVVVAPGRLTIKAGGSSYASITIVHGMFWEYYVYPAKITHFFKNL